MDGSECTGRWIGECVYTGGWKVDDERGMMGGG